MGKERTGRIEIVKNKKKEYFFRVIGKNGRTLCHSETYKTVYGCNKGLNALGDVMFHGGVQLVDCDPPKARKRKRDGRGIWR